MTEKAPDSVKLEILLSEKKLRLGATTLASQEDLRRFVDVVLTTAGLFDWTLDDGENEE
jgi:hypothetical protein